MEALRSFADHYNYVITIFLMVAGLYIVVSRSNMVKKLIGLSIFQTSVYLLYLGAGKNRRRHCSDHRSEFHSLLESAAACADPDRHRGRRRYLALGLALVVRINEAYGTVDDDEIAEGTRRMNSVAQHLPALQVVVPLLAGSWRRCCAVALSPSR